MNNCYICQAASTAASFVLTSLDLTLSLRDLLRVLEILSGGYGAVSSTSASFVFSAGTACIPSTADIRYLIQVVERLENRLGGIPLQADAATGVYCADMEGIFLLDLFVACGISIDKVKGTHEIFSLYLNKYFYSRRKMSPVLLRYVPICSYRSQNHH